jgi:hypothetical protein
MRRRCGTPNYTSSDPYIIDLVRLIGRVAALLGVSLTLSAHDIITTPITFDREILRIIYSRCASCHHDGGSAFSLMTYTQARPWAVAIKEEVLSRRMPPWGAVKGFGDFLNEQALTPEQLELITNWVEGGVPEGVEKDLPPAPKWDSGHGSQGPQIGQVSGTYTVKHDLKLGGLLPIAVPPNASLRITASFPDGRLEPLLWLENYKPQFGHPFMLRTPLMLPAGTVIHGVPEAVKVALLPPIAPTVAVAKH